MNLCENKVPELIQEADRSKWTAHNNDNVKCFTKAEIETLTNNFHTVIGSGGFGEVFQGVLDDSSMVAVKRFIHNVKENFAKELSVHSIINHKNVVRLIGYCVDENALMMVTEYIPNGNLSDVLHQDNTAIPLDIRLRIATECAEAFAYMHSHMYTHSQVIHGDIKPDNILLDASFSVKISDFGISRLVSTDTTLYTENVIGSIGYMDPLFARDGRLTVKSDVYSFGVVLLELITRKKATTKVGEVSFIDLWTDVLSRGTRGIREMFDVEITNQNNMKTLEAVAKLVRECLRMERDRRPEMIDVAVRLRVLVKALHQERQRVELFFWARKKGKSAENGRRKQPIASVVSGSTTTSNAESSSAASKVGEEIKVASPLRKFAFDDLKRATKNFSSANYVAEGGFGYIYKGWIEENGTAPVKPGTGLTVAVKKVKHGELVEHREWVTEVDFLGNLHHPNLAELIGYCVEDDQRLLVYEYMPRGSLDHHLFKGSSSLPWAIRMKIALGAAKGLAFVHEEAGKPVIHRNFNTSHILLDAEYDAKLSSFGLAKDAPVGDKTHVTTRVMGTSGYADPRYIATGYLTSKSDVYSFGVVLLEIMSGRRSVDNNRPAGERNLVEWAHPLLVGGRQRQRFCKLIDPRLERNFSVKGAQKAAQLARACLCQDHKKRPLMSQVVDALKPLINLEDMASSS